MSIKKVMNKNKVAIISGTGFVGSKLSVHSRKHLSRC